MPGGVTDWLVPDASVEKNVRTQPVCGEEGRRPPGARIRSAPSNFLKIWLTVSEGSPATMGATL